jgi:Proteasome assembly chaperone 3
MTDLIDSEWATVTTGQTKSTFRIRLVEYSNSYLIFLFKDDRNRISSYVQCKYLVDPLSGQSDFDVQVLLGDRDDIWSRVIARRSVELLQKDVVLALSLGSELNEALAIEISTAVIEVIRRSRPRDS